MKRFIVALMMTGIAGVAFADDDPVHFEPGQKGFGFITEHGTEAGAEERESSEMDGEPMQGMPADGHLPDVPPQTLLSESIQKLMTTLRLRKQIRRRLP